VPQVLVDGCASRIQKRNDSEPVLYDTDACYTGTASLTLGVGGSATSCTRTFGVVLFHFLLPEVEVDSISSVSLGFDVVRVNGEGIDAVLQGLGLRSGASIEEVLAQQTADDYSIGSFDLSSTLITSDFMESGAVDSAASVDVPVSIEFTHAELTNYVKYMLSNGGSGQYLVLRATGVTDLGCASSCGGDCIFKRYQLDGSSVKLILSTGTADAVADAAVVEDSPPPPAADPVASDCDAACHGFTCGHYYAVLTCSDLETYFGCSDCGSCCQTQLA